MDHDTHTLPRGGTALLDVDFDMDMDMDMDMDIDMTIRSFTAVADEETISFTCPGGFLAIPPGRTVSYALVAAGGGGGASPLYGQPGGAGGAGAAITGRITNHTGATQTLQIMVGEGGAGGRPIGSASGGLSDFSAGGDGGRQSGGGGGGGGGGGASAILAGSTVLLVAGGGGGGGGEGTNAPSRRGDGEAGTSLGDVAPGEAGGPAGNGQNARAYHDGSGGGGGGATPGRGGEVFVDGAEGGIGGSSYYYPQTITFGSGYFKITVTATTEGESGGMGAAGTADSTSGAAGLDGSASFSGAGIYAI